MRAPKTRGIKRVLSEHDEEKFVTDYELVRKRLPPIRVPVTLVVVPHQSRDDDSLCLRTATLIPIVESVVCRHGVNTPEVATVF